MRARAFLEEMQITRSDPKSKLARSESDILSK